jgi:hypothetical protein
MPALRFLDRNGSWIDKRLEAGQALGGEIAEQQANPEQQHQSRRAEFDARTARETRTDFESHGHSTMILLANIAP